MYSVCGIANLATGLPELINYNLIDSSISRTLLSSFIRVIAKTIFFERPIFSAAANKSDAPTVMLITDFSSSVDFLRFMPGPRFLVGRLVV